MSDIFTGTKLTLLPVKSNSTIPNRIFKELRYYFKGGLVFEGAENVVSASCRLDCHSGLFR